MRLFVFLLFELFKECVGHHSICCVNGSCAKARGARFDFTQVIDVSRVWKSMTLLAINNDFFAKRLRKQLHILPDFWNIAHDAALKTYERFPRIALHHAQAFVFVDKWNKSWILFQ